MVDTLEIMNQKIDLLTEQVAYLTAQARGQQRRQQAFDELKDDMIPIANHMIKLSIDELAEIGDEFQFEDLLFLLKRVLRNTNLIMEMFDRLEALMGLADETTILGKQVFNFSIEQLDQFERKGYFDLAREGWLIVERILAEFTADDLRTSGENIITLIHTLKNLTQPEVLSLANNAVGAIQQDIPEDVKISMWALVREFNDPKVRRGLLRMINLLKALEEN